MIPLSCREYRFSNLDFAAFHGLPGLVSDALPDRFGTSVFNAWLGANRKEMTNVERLIYIANNAMGALEFERAGYYKQKNNTQLNLKTLLKTKSDVLVSKSRQRLQPNTNLDILMDVGSVAGECIQKRRFYITKEATLFARRKERCFSVKHII